MSFSSSKLFEDDDDDLSGSSRKSNLGNLFGAATSATGKDSSLTYQRPKAPTKGDASAAKPASKSNLPALLYTTRVDLYKTGTNPPEYAQIGAAIVENPSGPSKFNLILYYTREKVIAMVSITRDFVLTLQLQDGTNFGSFYDSKQTLWSFRFMKPEDMEQLAIFVAVAKHYEEPGQIVTQELAATTKGGGAVKDDILGVRYVSYSEKLGKLSEAIEDNHNKPQPLKYVVGGVNKTAFAGWEVGLDGLKRGGKRVLLVPSESGDGTSMVYKLYLEKMKKASAPVESAPNSGKLPRAASVDHAHEGASVSEGTPEPGSPVGDNSNAILQRMSKMAVATPFAGGGLKSSLSPGETTQAPEANVANSTQPQMNGETASQNFGSPQQPMQTSNVNPGQAAPMQASQMQHPMNMQQANMSGAYPMNPMMGANQPAFGQTPGYGMGMGASSGYGPNNAGFGAGFGAANGYGPNAGNMYGSANALSLYNPQQQMMWDMQHGGMGPWGAAGVPLGPPQAAPAKPAPAAEPAPAAAPSASSKDILSQAEAIQLLIDGRQFQSEIKTSLTKMSTQLEDVEERLEGTMFTKNKDLGGGVTAKVLLQTITRIVGENERMLEELSSRDEKIDLLTLKLNKLHETNQRVIDENNRFMEERSSNFKTATDSQLRQLETFREEKTQLEMELTSANRQFQTLKRSFTNVSTELETLKEEMERLKTDRDMAVSKYAGVAGASQSAESRLLEEQSARRKLELDVQQLRDELATERESVETLRRDVEDRKTRYSREAANLEQHHSAEKAAYEEQIAKLQEALRKERATLGASAEQAASEIESKWSARYKSDVQRVQSTLEAEWEAKFEQHRATIEAEARDRIRQLKEAAAELSSASTAEFEAERTTWREKEQAFRRHIAQLQEVALSSTEAQEVIARLRAEISESAANNTASIKSIMNQVYFSLNGLFEEGEQIQYNKTGIMDTLKRMIVVTTKRMTNPDEELPPVEKPAPVEPVRVVVREEVIVPVPVSVADPSPNGHKEVVERFMEIAHPEEPALNRVDSDSQIEVAPSVFVSDSVPVAEHKIEEDDQHDLDDPLAPKKEEEEEEVPKPTGPIDDGWEALAQHEPDFVQPVAIEAAEEPQEIDPLSAPAQEEEFDPLSAPTLASDDVASDAPLAVEESPVVTSPEAVVEAEATQAENSEISVEENPLAVTGADPVAEDDVEIIPLSASVADVDEEETHVETPVEAQPTETAKTEEIVVAPVEESQEPEVVPEPEIVTSESVEAAEPVAEPVESKPVFDGPFGVEEAIAPNGVSTSIAVEDDDDPFGVNEPSPKESVAPAPVAEEDDDPFGVNEPKSSDSPAHVAPAASSAVEAETESITTSMAAETERPASPPNFFLDATQPKSNDTTPAKKMTFFDGDDEDEPKPAATGAPATEPKKKASSFFDDDDTDFAAPAPAKKAPSSASKAFSFGDDDDDAFGTSSTKSKSTKKADALDDIFGGISSSGSTAKKGLFDD
jgi:archaellum component FlaC